MRVRIVAERVSVLALDLSARLATSCVAAHRASVLKSSPAQTARSSPSSSASSVPLRCGCSPFRTVTAGEKLLIPKVILDERTHHAANG